MPMEMRVVGPCEQCGEVMDLFALRPFGKRLESGRRQVICAPCGSKNEPDTSRAVVERMFPESSPESIEEFLQTHYHGVATRDPP